MINVIIPAAVRKDCKRCVTCRILACESSSGTPSLCLQTWRNDTETCSNLPRKHTRTSQIIIREPLWIWLKWGDSFNTGWLCTCSNIDFRSFLTKKQLRTSALRWCVRNNLLYIKRHCRWGECLDNLFENSHCFCNSVWFHLGCFKRK